MTENTQHRHDFKAIRIIRTILGAVVVLAFIFDISGLAHRVAANPAVAAVVFGAMSQVAGKEEIKRAKDTVGGLYE